MLGQRSPLARTIQKLSDFAKGPAAILVWIAAIAMTAFLFKHRSNRYEYVGLARGLEYSISSDTAGKIESVLVDLCGDVKAGDIVAKLDDSLLKAGLETARASIRRLEAQIKADELRLRAENDTRLSDWKSNLAGLNGQEERYRIESLELKVEIESGRIEAQRLGLEVERVRGLLDAKVETQENFDQVKLRFDQVERRILDNTIQAAKIEKCVQEASLRREDYLKCTPQALPRNELLAPLREAIHKQELEMEELRIRREAMILRAPVSGRVSQVFCQTGQSVSPGEKIVLISAREAFQVVGYAPEGASPALREKMRVEISRADRPEKIAEASVIRLGAAIEPIPQRLWRDQRRPEFGRCFVISASAPLALLPGEKMRIRPIQ